MNDTLLAALLLSNPLTRVDAAPLKSREFWAVVDRCNDRGIEVGDLLGASDAVDAVSSPDVPSDRLASLLDATRAFAFDVERLEEGGVHLLSAFDPRFPTLLRDRMRHRCPPHVFAAGDIDALRLDGVAIVGDDPDVGGDVGAGGDSLDDVRRAAAAAVAAGWSVVTATRSSAHSQTRSAATDEVLACDGRLVVVADSGINRAARPPETRRHIQEAQMCLISPFGPDSVESAASTRARDGLVSASATLTLVMACADGIGSTWAAAVESVVREPASVVTLVGDRNDSPGIDSSGNRALAALGARTIHVIDDLHGLLT